jgi:hypothetical protein
LAQAGTQVQPNLIWWQHYGLALHTLSQQFLAQGLGRFCGANKGIELQRSLPLNNIKAEVRKANLVFPAMVSNCSQ